VEYHVQCTWSWFSSATNWTSNTYIFSRYDPFCITAYGDPGFKKVFINCYIEEETGEEWTFNEGCLSIPDVREDVSRKNTVTISYLDENFKEHTETYDGLLARVIQHEYDHIEGVLFTDKLSSLKKRLLKGRLSNISKGKIRVDYKMRFPDAKKAR